MSRPEAMKAEAVPAQASPIKAVPAVRIQAAKIRELQALLLSTENIAIVPCCEYGSRGLSGMNALGKITFPGAIISSWAVASFLVIQAFTNRAYQFLRNVGLLQKIQSLLDDEILPYNVGAVTAGKNGP